MTISDSASDTASYSRSTNRWLMVLGFIAVSVVSIMLTNRAGTVTDVSWIITVIEQMEAGQRLYVDIIEANPPFSIWLYFPAVKAAHMSSVSPEVAVAIYTYGAAFFGFGLTVLIAHRGRLIHRNTQWWLWPAILSTLLILPVGAFAQREHIGLALFLPLLAVTAWRFNESEQNTVPVILAIVAGLAGSIMILVKPHWALAIVLPAIYTVIAKRSLMIIVTIEFVIVGAVALAYLASVIVIYPQFFETMYPMLTRVYLPIRADSSVWPAIFAPFAVALSVWVLRRVRGRVSTFADMMALAAIGFFLAMVFLGKGWYYHRYPSTAAALIASIIALEQTTLLGITNGIYRMSCAALVLLSFARPVYNWSILGNKLDMQLVAAVRGQHANPDVVTIGSDIGLAFPFVRLVGGRLVSAYCSDWAGAHALFRLAGPESDLSGEERVWLEAFLNDHVKTKIDNIRRDRPDFIVEAKSGSRLDHDWIQYLYSVRAFKDVMAQYEPLVENRHVAVWRRKNSELSAR